MSRRSIVGVLIALIATTALAVQGLRSMREKALAEPFRGVTRDGTVQSDLFAIRATGVSTEPIRIAAEHFLASLSEAQRKQTHYALDDIEWRKWDNVHRAPREGVSLGEMTEEQRVKVWAMLDASLSAKGVQKSRNVMKLNQHLGELVSKPEEYGDGFYWFTVMGEPSTEEPWGWQLDGHHLAINYFVLGDQVVMTPAFMGSEPVIGSGAYAGISVMQDEQERGYALMKALTPEQRATATLDIEKARGNMLAAAYNDNLVLDYAGLEAGDMTDEQRRLLLELIAEYVGNMRPEHAKVKMTEVESQLDETHFAWIGEFGPDAVFYYRVQSPVVLIEFDHQGPVALDGPRAVPNRRHVHSVVRTPNGNDYGKDLLRQHYEQHAHDPTHGHHP